MEEIVDEAGKEGPYHEGSSVLRWAFDLYSSGKEQWNISKKSNNRYVLGKLV